MLQPQSQIKTNSYRVVHDLQTGRYYKVHIKLGKQIYVNKDGSPVTKFRPGVSGCHKPKNQDTFEDQNVASLRYQDWLSKQLPNMHKQTKSDKINLADLRRKGNSSQQKLTACSALSFQSSLSIRSKNKEDHKGLKHYNRLTNFSSNKKKVDQVDEMIQSYNQIIRNRERQNHSLKKQQVPGGYRFSKPSDLELVTSKYYSNKSSSISLAIAPNSRVARHSTKCTLEALPQSCSSKRQYLKDRQLYFSINPDKRIVQKAPDHDRRFNLKKLEGQSIRQNEFKTRKIYQTIQI